MPTWDDLFSLIQSSDGVESREGQKHLGNALIQSMSTGETLIAEAQTGSGKSIAILLPLIDVVKGNKPLRKFRGVISTETLGLQDQYISTLEWLHSLNPAFSYCSLKGRSHYLCLNAARNNVIGNLDLAKKLQTIETRRGSLNKGERTEVEKITGLLSDKEWGSLVGSSVSCYEYTCTSEDCYSAKARKVALKSNIVVCSHAVLQVDGDQRASGGDGILGDFEYLFVDEAHTLESVLIDGWTEELSEWELNKAGSTLVDGVVASMTYTVSSTLDRRVAGVVSEINDFLTNTADFFQMIHPDEEWDRVEDSIRLHWVTCKDDRERAILQAYETDGLASVKKAKKVYAEALKHLDDVLKAHGENMSGKDRKAVKKGITAAKTLSKVIGQIEMAMGAKTGTIVEYGVPYAVTVSGRTRRNGDLTADIRVVPLDISTLAATIWKGRKVALLSATLRDMTDGTFRYTAASLGIGNHNEIVVSAPFDYRNVQKVYVTTGQSPVVPDIKNAKYSFEEMVDLIHAAQGRTLVLFTSRVELEDAAHRLLQLMGEGKFNYPLLIQWAGANKKKLADDFIESTESVLLGLSSFGTGFDAPGETVSQVILARYPLIRYDAVCKQQISWWRNRGFKNFYEMKSMNVFRQYSGRLIRSNSCRGVISLLDQRAIQEGQNVRKTALSAVQSLGSVVTQDIEEVRKFLK